MIRELESSEFKLLKDFLYEAIFIPEGVKPPAKEIVERPELRIYYEILVQAARTTVLGQRLTAVWLEPFGRSIIDDYGHVDDETPSFAISLYEDYRGRGIGTQLMVEMLELLKQRGYRKASLAVQKANYAVRMYRKVGFKTVDENSEEYIMVCEL